MSDWNLKLLQQARGRFRPQTGVGVFEGGSIRIWSGGAAQAREEDDQADHPPMAVGNEGRGEGQGVGCHTRRDWVERGGNFELVHSRHYTLGWRRKMVSFWNSRISTPRRSVSFN